MEYRRLGSSGLKISQLCLGAMTFGHSTEQDEAQRIVDAALDAGVNFFDTANNYGNGQSEVLLGRALRGRRRQAVIATKFFNPFGDGPNDSGTSRVAIMNAVDDSLERLGVEHIDVYYVHHLDVETPAEETIEALDDLVRSGKVRYIACSNYPAWRLCDAWWISTARELSRFIACQLQYSLVVRDIEQELVPLCRDKGMGIVAWGPLAGGFLTGKYKPGERTLPGTRSQENWVWQARMFAGHADDILSVLLEVSEQLGRNPAEVALRWVMDRPGVSSAIVGARTVEQFQRNLGALEFELPEDVRVRLDEVSHLPDRYPESFERDMPARRANAIRVGRKERA